MPRNRILLLIVGACVFLSAGWYFGSPRWTLYQMQQAAEARDADAFSEHVDFPALRESVKAQLKAKIMREMQKEQNNPFAGLGMMLGMGMVDSLIDSLLTPSTLQAMFENAKAADGQETKSLGGIRAAGYVIDRTDFSVFHLIDPNGRDKGDLKFKRDGLGWRLVDVRMPE